MIVSSLVQAILELPPELTVILVAALPLVELRGAIPLGFTLGLSPLETLVLAVVGNLLPIPFVLLLMQPVGERLRRTRTFRGAVEWLYRRTHARSGLIKRYGVLGLVIFVAVPIPTTGAWTGAIAASLLGIRFGQAFPALIAGVILAGGIVVTLTAIGYLAVG